MKVDKVFEDQIDPPLIITDPSEVEWNQEVRSYLKNDFKGDESLFINIWHQRAAFFDECTTSIIPKVGNSFILSFPEEPVIMHRKAEFKGNTFYEDEKGHIVNQVETHTKRDLAIKEDTKVLWSDGVITWTLNKTFDGTPLNQVNAEELRIRQLTRLIMRQSLMNIIKRRSDKNVFFNGNDMLIEGKKVMGAEVFIYDSCYHEHGIVTWDIPRELVEEYMSTDKNHLNSLKKREKMIVDPDQETKEASYSGITMLSKELDDPNYSKKDFIAELIKEVNHFMFMIDMLPAKYALNYK